MNGIRLLCVLAAAVVFCPELRAQNDSADASRATLTTLEQVRALEPYQADQGLPVAVTGTVIFAEPHWHSFVIHDGTVGVMAFDPMGRELRAGQKVSLTGQTNHQPFATHVEVEKLEVIGEGDPLPAAQKLTGALQLAAAAHSQWVEFEGVIVTVDRDERHHYLRLAGRQFPVFVVAPPTIGSPPRASIEGCRIKLRGVCVLKKNGAGSPDFEIWAPEGGIVAIGPGPSGRENPPSVRLKDLEWSEVSARETAAVQSRVTVSHVDGRRLFVTDGTEHTIVEANHLPNVSAGDLIRVRGVVSWNGQKAHITGAEVTALGKYERPEATAVPVSNAVNHLGELIAVEATVVGRRERSSGDIELLMHDDTTAFQAVIRSGQLNTTAAERGTRLKLSGGCWHAADGEYPFALAVDSARPVSGVGVTVGPPVWPVRILLGSSVLLLGTGLLVWLHRRRLREQKQFYAHVHEQLDSMAHVSRVNTLAEMVGALSHELSQPLASMSNFATAAESLSDRVEDAPPQLSPIIGRIKDEARRANELIRRLRLLTRKQTPGREPADIDAIVMDAVELFRLQDPDGALSVSQELHGALPEVIVDSIQMEQVLLNVLNNARDATQDIPGRRPSVCIRTRQLQNQVEIQVEDNGHGMSEADCRKSFEPYVTTKPEGTGLGLAISRTIVESHGGQIVAEPQEPHGTRLRLTLPVARAAPGPKLAAG